MCGGLEAEDGELQGRKDDLLINHEEQGIELLVFYRVKRGNPYLTLATAGKLDSLDKKYAYLEPDGQRNLRPQ